MPYALLLALAAIAGGALLTYLYDRDGDLFARLCAGACTGLAALGLVGFVISSFAGLTPSTLLLSGALVAAPLLLLLRRGGELPPRVRADAREAARDLRRALTLRDRGAAATLLYFLAAALLLSLVFGRAMYSKPEGVFTGLENNIGDLPFHVGIVTGFVHGENFPPEHPEYAGARLTYPFLVDFITAMLVRAGATLEGALFWQNFLLAFALAGLLRRWAAELTRDRVAALLTPVLVLFNGGLGFWHFLREAGERGLTVQLGGLTHYYTMWGASYRWGNAITTLLVPQRGLLLGLPLALVVWTLWWKTFAGDGETKDGGEKVESGHEGKGRGGERSTGRYAGEKRGKGKARGGNKKSARHASGPAPGGGRGDAGARLSSPFYFAPPTFPPATSFPAAKMLAAGIVAGLLPLAHAHSFVVMMGMGGCLALLSSWDGVWTAGSGAGEGARARVVSRWKAWAVFFAAALALAVPQMLWATYKSDVQAGSFFGWHFGWDRGEQSVVVFWLKSTGLFIPLLVAALAWRGRQPLVPARLLLFYLPFTLCFVVPNLVKLSPWVWDNIKVIFYWWIASAPIVALLLAHLWRRGAAWRIGAAALVVVLTFAGALDVWRVVSGSMENRVFERDGVAFAEMVREKTAPRSLILHAPTYNHPVLLTGRRGLVGYAGHLWSHGITAYGERERDAGLIYAGGAQAEALLEKYRIEYVVVGPLERYEMASRRVAVNETFFQRYTKVGQSGGYSLYKTTR